MKSNDNPFMTVIKNIRDDNRAQAPAYYRLGTVTSVLPLRVDVAGAIQDDNSLLKNSDIAYFEVGNRLLLMPIEDEQRYIIVCKVVNA